MKENLIDNHWNEFLINPLNVVDRLFKQMGDEMDVKEFHNLLKDQLSNLLQSNPLKLEEIPFLNNRNLNYDKIRNKSLVRYRCMIQDMFNPEIYAAILNTSTNNKKLNLYTDSVYLDDKYFINPDKNTIMDRFIYYMISIPGVNEWVKHRWDMEGKLSNLDNLKQQSNENDLKKRILEDDSLKQNNLDNLNNSFTKKKKLNDLKDNQQSTNTVHKQKKDYCTPIKQENEFNRPCIVKLYDCKEEELKLNDLVEVIGIIEFPNFENRTFNKSEKNSINDDNKFPEISSMLDNLDLDHEDYVYSEIPRIHALNIIQLTSINPFNKLNSTNCSTKSSIYARLSIDFERMFLGDKLASDYFICWLISRVYKIQDSLPIGNFPINISNLNKISNNEQNLFINKLYEIIECLCTHSLNLPITINELNTRILNPFKDKDNTKLQSGLLQLPTNFYLLLDETSLQPGQLKELGLRNLSTLKDLINWQSIEYNHIFYTQKINTDINVIVLSEGKSLFDVKCEIKLKPNESYTDVDQLFKEINYFLNDMKEDYRNYLNYVRTINCEISADLQKKIQDDFVKMRKDTKSRLGIKICSDDLHHMISLSRLLAISEGSTQLTEEHWEKAISMESERRNRLNV